MATQKNPTGKAKLLMTPKKKGQVTTYVPISHHIYFDGFSYRVRVNVNGTRYSKNFPSQKKAYAFRKSLLTNA